MEVVGVTAQWQAVAGSSAAAPSLIRSAESSGLRGGNSLRNFSRFAPLGKQSRSSRSGKDGLQVVAMAPQKKVNAYDDAWSKQWFGAGFFNENIEQEDTNIIKKLEKKKLLSQVEKAGLLSKAESAGLSLSTIEKLGLLSKAEDLGLLTLAEKFVTSSPATLASLSLPLLVASIVTLVVVPDSSTPLVVAQNIVAALLLASAGGLFIGSIILSGLQEE